jgi:hypothetical protein
VRLGGGALNEIEYIGRESVSGLTALLLTVLRRSLLLLFCLV